MTSLPGFLASDISTRLADSLYAHECSLFTAFYIVNFFFLFCLQRFWGISKSLFPRSLFTIFFFYHFIKMIFPFRFIFFYLIINLENIQFWSYCSIYDFIRFSAFSWVSQKIYLFWLCTWSSFFCCPWLGTIWKSTRAGTVNFIKFHLCLFSSIFLFPIVPQIVRNQLNFLSMHWI